MKKRFVVTLLILALFAYIPTINTNADSSPWNTIETAQEIVFGNTYEISSNEWYYKDFLNNFVYMKVTLPQRGIVTVTVEEPLCENGEVAKNIFGSDVNYIFTTYDKDYKIIAGNGISRDKETKLVSYSFCQKAGVYYIRMGVWEENDIYTPFSMKYKVTYTQDNNCIISTNGEYLNSQKIQLNKEYNGCSGSVHYSSFNFELEEDNEVSIILKNCKDFFDKNNFFNFQSFEGSGISFIKTLNLDNAKVNKTTGDYVFTYNLKKGQYYLEAWSNWNSVPFTIKIQTPPSVTYRTQVQKEGWQTWRKDGALSGTKTNKRLEGIQIKLQNKPYTGNIQYKTYIQKIGWESAWASNGKLSGTVGKALRLEGIRIKLSGEMSNQYNVYYRTYVEGFGWLGWAKNGDRSGTAGYGYKLEGIQIKLISKSGTVPKSSTAAFRTKGK